MLGLGRAIGETIAVTLVIGNSPTIGKQIFDQGYTLAAVIANEFGEAANDKVHAGALIAAGLVLFVLTLAHQRAGARPRAPRREARAPRSRPSPEVPHEPRSPSSTPRRRRTTDQVMRARARARHAHRADPAGRRHLLPAEQGPRRVVVGLLHQGPDRQLPRRPGRRQERAARDDRDGGLGRGHRDPVRLGRRALPGGVRPHGPLRRDGALLRRRDDRRAVDRLRPVHLRDAGASAAGAASRSRAGRARSPWRC